MKSNKSLGKLAGLIFLINLIPYVVAHMVILDELLYAPNYLQELSTNQAKVGIAILMEFISIVAMIGFAVLVFSILRKFGNKLAIGYLGLRFIEFGIIIYSIIKLISITTLSKMIMENENIDLTYSQLLADSMLAEWEWIGIIYMLVYVLHCLIFFYLLLISRLVPKIISIVGLIGAILAFANIVNHLFDLDFGGFFLFAPMGIIELILALWLLIYGFKEITLNVNNKQKADNTVNKP